MTDTKPCARCGKQNPAEIHTCTSLALRVNPLNGRPGPMQIEID